MRQCKGILVFAVAAIVAGQFGGCISAATIPFDINLGSNAEYAVTSGTPTTRTFKTTFSNDSGVAVGSGSIEISTSTITITTEEADTNGVAKVLQGSTALPIPESCGDACSLAGQSDAICTSVCTSGDVVIMVWVGLESESEPMTTGDEYGPYVVTLDGEASPLTIEPSTFTLQAKTIQAINEGAATITVQITSPYNGSILLDAIILNAGL